MSKAEEAPILAECGDLGFRRHSGIVDEEFHRDLRGTKAIKKYREMYDNHAVIGMSMWLSESLLRPVTWTMKPNDSGHPQANEAAEKTEQAIHDMRSKWGGVISAFLTSMIFGWVVLEPTYKIRAGRNESKYLNSKHSDGMFGWRDWGIRSQESLDRWIFDEDGYASAMIQRPPHDSTTRTIPLSRCLHYIPRPWNGSPEGKSLMRPVYTSYHRSERHMDISSIGMERDIAGLPVMELPLSMMNKNADEKSKANRAQHEKMVRKIRMDSYMGAVVPTSEDRNGKTGFNFKLLSSSGKGFQTALEFVKHYDSRIATMFFTQMQFLGQDSTGSKALSSDHTENLSRGLGTIQNGIAEVINDDAIPRLCYLNGYPSEAYPTYTPGDIEKQSIAESGAFVSAMIGSGGMEATPDINDWGRSMIDLPPSENPFSGMAPDLMTQDPLQAAPPVAVAPPVPVPVEAAEDEIVEELPPMMNAQEASQIFGVSRGVINAAIKRGQIPGVRIGSQFMMNREAVMALFEKQDQPPPPQPVQAPLPAQTQLPLTQVPPTL